MVFTPSTIVRILRNVPLDSTYKNTLTFQDTTEQQLFFSGKAKYSFTDFSYQRQNGSIRVSVNSNSLYDCNYVMFQNENFGNKWFYGFITEVNYLNPETSEILFEIDVLQTWYFDFTVKQCFVEREHVNDDTIGANTIPENLETGAYITTAETSLKASDLNIYILATDANEQNFWNDPAIVGGFPVPTYWVSLGSISDFSVTVLKLILESYATAGKVDAIVAMFTAPSNMVSTQSGVREQNLSCAPRTMNYIPKNNKLYCYPYCALSLTALGQGVELKYELFSNSQPSLKIRGGFGANMQVAATPLNYEGQTENIQNTISLSGFPLCAWITNYYQNWLAQNKASISISTLTSAVQIGTGVATAAAGGAAMYASGGAAGGAQVVGGLSAAYGGAVNIAQTMATVYQHSIIPDKMTGSANAADIFAVSGKSGFYTYCRTIRPEYAKIIDDYFSMFGYKVNALKIPNIKGRQSWNYVKTAESVIVGSIPVDAMVTIKEIFNRGITFWHGDFVGDYSRSNNIV